MSTVCTKYEKLPSSCEGGKTETHTNALLKWHTTPWLALSASLRHWFLSLQVWRKCCDERLEGREMKGGWIKNREVKNLILNLSLSRGKKNKPGGLGYPPSLLSTSDLWSFTQTWHWSDLGFICKGSTVSSNPQSQLLRSGVATSDVLSLQRPIFNSWYVDAGNLNKKFVCENHNDIRLIKNWAHFRLRG